MAHSDDSRTAQVYMRDLRPDMHLMPLQSPPTRVSEAEIDDEIARTLAESKLAENKLAEHRQVEARAALTVISHQEILTGHAGHNARSKAVPNGDALYPGPERAGPADIDDLTGRTPSPLRRLGSWLLRAAVVVAAIAALKMAPLATPLLMLSAAGLTVALGVVMGTDRAADVLTRVFHWQNERDPDRAERFRAGVDRVATGMDAALDRLPERWTVGLYMPDFSREALLQDMDETRPDPFDRIAAGARQV